jgi:hypothetical protein
MNNMHLGEMILYPKMQNVALYFADESYAVQECPDAAHKPNSGSVTKQQSLISKLKPAPKKN